MDVGALFNSELEEHAAVLGATRDALAAPFARLCEAAPAVPRAVAHCTIPAFHGYACALACSRARACERAPARACALVPARARALRVQRRSMFWDSTTDYPIINHRSSIINHQSINHLSSIINQSPINKIGRAHV